VNQDKLFSTLQQHLPAPAVEYCFNLWLKYKFVFKLRKARITKAGDFTFKSGHTPRITVNSDLHPYSFLITYVHEVAHLEAHAFFGHRVEAHGDEWKKTFQQLMMPVLSDEIFPPTLLVVLKRHMLNPKASSFSDSELTAALRSFDANKNSIILLSQIPEGSVFGLHGRWFKKGRLKRTRVMCREVNTKRDYLVPLDAPVSGAQLSLSM
jgi:SprT protein